MLALLRFFLLLGFVAAQTSVTILDPEDLKIGIDAGEYDAIIDVRTQEEWDAGHIAGATFALNLAMFGDPTRATASPADFVGCETCTIVVYCRSGARASVALENLIAAGFNGTLYNGQGTSQWENAGYSLVNDDSVVPPCSLSKVGQCAATSVPSAAPSVKATPIIVESAAPSMTSSMAPSAAPEGVMATTLQPEAFKNGIDNGEFDAIIDVRRQDEWDTGHIEGATFALNLAMFGDPTRATASPADFMGCETCTIVVYCRSGARAGGALEKLIAAGFNGTLYNGLGTSQWTAAGYSLVTTDSVVPSCTKSGIGSCVAHVTTEPMTTAPSTNMTTGDMPDNSSASNIQSCISTMAILVGILSALQLLALAC